jgi:hypothetical protein
MVMGVSGLKHKIEQSWQTSLPSQLIQNPEHAVQDFSHGRTFNDCSNAL